MRNYIKPVGRNREILRTAADLVRQTVYPQVCPVCGKLLPVSPIPAARRDMADLICGDCLKKLPWVGPPACLLCGRPLPGTEEGMCRSCARGDHLFTEGRSIFRYEGGMRASVLQMKFHNRREHLDFFAAAMAEAGSPFLRRVRPACLVPVPMHKRKRRERGFDQCRLLTEKLSERTGIPMADGLLRREKATRPQKGLGAAGRRANLRGAIRAVSAPETRGPVLLVDDIYTSGATMDACCGALWECGITEVYFLALCTEPDPVFRQASGSGLTEAGEI